MLLDSVEGLRSLHQQFEAFLASSQDSTSFPALTTGNPAPYNELLGGVRVRKTTQASELLLSRDRWLELAAPPNELAQFSKKLLVTDDHGHHHWYSNPLSLIIEADDGRASSES